MPAPSVTEAARGIVGSGGTSTKPGAAAAEAIRTDAYGSRVTTPTTGPMVAGSTPLVIYDADDFAEQYNQVELLMRYRQRVVDATDRLKRAPNNTDGRQRWLELEELLGDLADLVGAGTDVSEDYQVTVWMSRLQEAYAQASTVLSIRGQYLSDYVWKAQEDLARQRAAAAARSAQAVSLTSSTSTGTQIAAAGMSGTTKAIIIGGVVVAGAAALYYLLR